jgi:hypothetical protein
MVRLCPVCGQMVALNEASLFGGRHEDCWIDTLPSLDAVNGSWIEACAEACEENPKIKEKLRDAAVKAGLDDGQLSKSSD